MFVDYLLKNTNALCYNYFITAMPRYPKLKLIQIQININNVSIASLKENKQTLQCNSYYLNLETVFNTSYETLTIIAVRSSVTNPTP